MEILFILMKGLDFLFLHEKTFNRFRWSTENIDALLECLKNIKARYEFIGLDFESDFVSYVPGLYPRAKRILLNGLNLRSNFTLNLLQII